MGRALRYRMSSWLRSRFGLVVGLALLTALLLGIVLATAAGARRTDTAPDRYLASFGGGVDIVLYQDRGEPRIDEIAALPSVAAVDGMTFMFGILVGDDGVPMEAISFTGSMAAATALVVDGRAPRPDAPGEFVASRSFVDSSGMSIGDSALFVTQTETESREHGFDFDYVHGPQVEATLVGILTSPSELEDTTPMAVFPPSILTQGDIGLSASVMAVDLADGSTPGDLQADVAGLADASAFRVDDVISADLVSAVHGQAVGLWLLAGLGALAAVAAAGYLLSRNVKLTTDEELSLQALGATRVHRVVESAARAASVMAFAIALGWVIAIALSGLFPFGFAERMEPHPGLTVHVWLLLAAGLVMGVAVTAWVAVAALLRARHRTTTRTPLIDSIASRCPRASMATGVRFAFSARPGESARVTLGVVGTAAVVAALIGSLTFAAGMHELVDDPTRQGDNYDIAADNGAERIPDDAMAMLADSPAVQSVELYTATQVEVGGTSEVVALSGHEPFRGEPIDPVLLDGRQPIGDDEIALGRVTAHRLGLSIGDDIDLADDDFHATYRITGIVVPTAIGGNDLLGQGAVVTARGYDRLDPQREPHAALVDLDRAAPQAAVDELAAALGGDLDTPRQRPPAIISMSRITFVPYVLALLLAALATIVLAGAVYSSIRRRDHQVAVLRALGADRRWLIVSEAWHAAAATIVPTAVGVPIGLIAGRLVFRTYADDRGMVSTPVTPVGLGLGLLAALLVAAVVAALLAGRPARRTPPAVVLRTA